MIVTISDNTEFVANHYQADTSSKFSLLDQNNIKFIKNECYYTSLADLAWDELLDVCKKSDKIIYLPPPKWSCTELKLYTIEFLSLLTDVFSFNVEGFDSPTNNIFKLKSSRKSDSPQIWIAGCSFAVGKGLDNNQDKYGILLSQNLKMPYSDLCDNGSSIEWAADQILRSDIRNNDIVCWGITSINRFPYVIDEQQIHINLHTILTLDQSRKKIFNTLSLDDNIAYQSIKKIKQVINFLEKIKCRLVIFIHPLGIQTHNKIVYNHIRYEKYFLDISPVEDNAPFSKSHPGPITHKKWAEEIFNFLIKNTNE